MRQVADKARIERFLKAIGREADEDVRVYLTGGSTAVLYGWRGSTKDIDLKYDLYAQALSKIERGHAQDLADAREMAGRGLIELPEVLRHFEEIEPRLYRYPAIDPASFRRAVQDFAREAAGGT